MIHPAGLGGVPVSGQRCNAMTNASWTASSAMSMSPKRRTRVATARPDSCRKTSPISVPSGTAVTLSGLRLLLERAHLDGRLARTGGLGRPGQRLVEVGGGDDPEAAHLLL